MLSVQDLKVQVDGKTILSDFSISIPPEQLHVLMGPNGSGKSSLSLTLFGHRSYQVSPDSQVTFDGHDLLSLNAQQRAQLGLFLSFQHPTAIPGLKIQQLIKATNDNLDSKHRLSIAQLRQHMLKYCQLLHLNPEFLTRSVNDGFSGGEKKQLEMLQLLMIRPKLAILDEIDSGLDVDAIKIIAHSINYAQKEFKTAFLIVTHYRRILDHIKPDQVHIMVKGHLIKSGGRQLIEEIETNGYTQYDQPHR